MNTFAEKSSITSSSTTTSTKNTTLSQRICNLISERTQGHCQPTIESHRIYLVTHLCYYGYCFNPVSFYYVVDRNNNEASSTQTPCTAIVAEVSNTPWNEMYPYVLHSHSLDQVQVNHNNRDGNNNSTNYIFPKTFHVSPFMEMTYDYNWILDHWSPQKTRVVISMRQRKTKSNATTPTTTTQKEEEEEDTRGGSSSSEVDKKDNLHHPPTTTRKKEDGTTTTNTTEGGGVEGGLETGVQFTASMTVHAKGLHPFVLAWQLARYPTYCFIVQIWIHYEALRLFIKGISYKPHPKPGPGTAASRIIGRIMQPIVAWNKKKKNKNINKQSPTNTNTTLLSSSSPLPPVPKVNQKLD